MRLRRSVVTGPALRRARRGKGFSYYGPDGELLTDAETLERIKDLVIPPACMAEPWPGYVDGMADSEPFPDDVPLADAVEQQRAAAEPGNGDAEDHVVLDDTDAPLESNAADWQEQREVVEDPDADELR